MKIAIGGDHAGFSLKNELLAYFEANEFAWSDFGPFSDKSCDYPDFAHLVAQSVASGENEFGILICGSGNGVAMTANKYPEIRAAICWNEDLAKLSRAHNDANILCLPSRFIEVSLAQKICLSFLKTSFEGGRHTARVQKIKLH
jgi:ribose 5-phosphate isomerase B